MVPLEGKNKFICSVDLTFGRVLRGHSYAVTTVMAGTTYSKFTDGKKLPRTRK